MSHKKVGFRDDSPSGASHYSDHQRSDSGVGSLSGSDCGVPTGSDRTYTPRDYDDRRDAREILRLKNELTQKEDKIKDLQAKIQQLERLQASHIQLKVDHKEVVVSEASLQAQLEAKQNENEVIADRNADLEKANKELLQKNKDLTSENTKLKEDIKKLREFEDAKKPKELKDPKDSSESLDSEKTKRPRRKSMSMPPPSDSSDDRRPRRSSSRRAPHREHEKLDMDYDWDRQERERQQLEMERQLTLAHERPVIDEDMERLRSRFRTRGGDESDAKSSSQSLPSLPPATIRGQPRNNQRDSYIEPAGRGAPRPQVPGPQVVSARDAYDYAYNAPSYPAPQYGSIREPRSAAPVAHHPAVYVSAPAGYVDNRYAPDDDYRYQQAIASGKMGRRQ